MSLYLRHRSFSNHSFASPTSQLILQPLCRFTYVTDHSPTIPLLYLRHSSFSNHCFASPMSQLILQPFLCFTYVTANSPTLASLYLRHSSFSNPSFASPKSQALHLIHLTSRPCNVSFTLWKEKINWLRKSSLHLFIPKSHSFWIGSCKQKMCPFGL